MDILIFDKYANRRQKKYQLAVEIGRTQPELTVATGGVALSHVKKPVRISHMATCRKSSLAASVDPMDTN